MDRILATNLCIEPTCAALIPKEHCNCSELMLVMEVLGEVLIRVHSPLMRSGDP